MRVQKTIFAISLLFLAGTIVVPATSSVNRNSAGFDKGAIECADGSPLPLPPPPKGLNLVADGSPLPLPPPPKNGVTLVADGSPLPVPPPPNKGVNLVGGSLLA